jgi:L-histidine N-alpha-methyltransferase
MTAPARRAALEAVGVELHACPETWTALAADVLEGLTTSTKALPPKWFYDARGSELLDAICEQPEYYPTRREAALLAEIGPAVAAEVPAGELVELGSGSSTKTPLLLDPLAAAGTLRRYVPVDVSAAAIERAVPALLERHPGLEVDARVCDFTADLGALHARRNPPRLVAFLGSTIGNLQPAELHEFLVRVRPLFGRRDALLVGHDLVKDPSVIVPAYDDAAGVTAEFNRARVVRIASLGLEVTFQAGESILTEISRKFRRDVIERAAARAGLRLRAWHTDADGWYGVSLLAPAGEAG